MTDTVRAAINVRVAIVDDHPLVGGGLAALLATETNLEVVGVARDTAGAFELIDRARPDVVVCDVQLGDESGFSLLERYAGGSSAVVMYSSHDHPTYHRAAFDGGAAAFVLKSGESAGLVEAIRAAAAGRTSFSPSTIRAVRSSGTLPTPRELQVIEQLAEGRSTDEVAATLGIGPRTVESHLRSLFDRFDVQSRTDIVIRAVREGWIRPRSTGGTAERTGGPPPEGWVVDEAVLRAGRRTDAAASRPSRRPPRPPRQAR